MREYTVHIKETLELSVNCKADNMYQAIEKVEKAYKNEQYVLDSTDFVSVEFEVKNEKGEVYV